MTLILEIGHPSHLQPDGISQMAISFIRDISDKGYAVISGFPIIDKSSSDNLIEAERLLREKISNQTEFLLERTSSISTLQESQQKLSALLHSLKSATPAQPDTPIFSKPEDIILLSTADSVLSRAEIQFFAHDLAIHALKSIQKGDNGIDESSQAKTPENTSEKNKSAPNVEKQILIRPDESESAENWKPFIGNCSSYRDYLDRVWVFYTAQQPIPDSKPISRIGCSVFESDGKTLSYSFPQPVLDLREEDKEKYPNGLEDPRVTPWDLNHFLIVSAAWNRKERGSGKITSQDRNKPIKGVGMYLHLGEINMQGEIMLTPLGMVGPEGRYLKNGVLHPEIIMKKKQPHYMLYYRELPGIQASLIPAENLLTMIDNEKIRQKFWGNELKPETVTSNTILDPKFAWEAKFDPIYPNGQIAGGATPVEVIYQEPKTSEVKKAWLFLYNATLYFDPRGEDPDAIGRVIGAVLLDRENPYKVIARSPRPIIYPTLPEELQGRRIPLITFASGLDVHQNQANIYYTAGDQYLAVGSVELSQLVQFISQFDESGNLIRK